jgi:hypothetical protein
MPLLGAGKTEKLGSIGNDAWADGHDCPRMKRAGDMSYSRFWEARGAVAGTQELTISGPEPLAALTVPAAERWDYAIT